MRLAVLSDAHLLLQAEWIEDERKRTPEGEETIENFKRALDEVRRTQPNAILLAGDMFDYRTKRGHRVAHREGEKYMADIRDLLEDLADGCDCKIYALKGNHDSEPVLKSVERALRNKFFFIDNETVDIDGLSVYFMRTHYEPGFYDIKELPSGGDVLLMHEQVSIRPGMPGVPDKTLRELSARFELVLNGHMHIFKKGTLGIPNLILVPALIPSREIKEGWMYKVSWSYKTKGIKCEERSSPFGFIVLEDMRVKFIRYTPINKVVHAEIYGEKPSDFLDGVDMVYGHLMKLPNKSNLRIWIKTNADQIVIKRLLWPKIKEYENELCTVDILPLPRENVPRPVKSRLPNIEGALTRGELVERVLTSLSGQQKEIAEKLFERLFTSEYLRREVRKHELLREFMEAVRIITESLDGISKAFYERVRELARRG